MRSGGRPMLGPTSRHEMTPQQRLIAQLRARGARHGDFERMAQSAYENLDLPDAMRRFGQDVARAAQPRHSDLFDTPYDPDFGKDELR